MVFGKKRSREAQVQDETQKDTEIQNLEDDTIDEEDSIPNTSVHHSKTTSTNETRRKQDDKMKPLLNEVILSATQPKSSGGTKKWCCKFCKKSFSSSYTRIHYHFFGSPPRKKAEIARCAALLANRAEYERVRLKVSEAEKKGVSSSLKSSTLTRAQQPLSRGTVENAFAKMDRDQVDLMVLRGLCANGIPLNVLRNPQFHEMITAVNKGLVAYKPPSYERARTSLLDECKRNVENDMANVKATWFTHGVSIVSDGWTNVKHEPLSTS